MVWPPFPQNERMWIPQIDKGGTPNSHAVLMAAGEDLQQALGWLNRQEHHDLSPTQARAATREARERTTQALMHVVSVVERIEAAADESHGSD